MYGYLRRFKSAAIRVRIEQSDFSSLPVQGIYWLDKNYGNVKEEIEKDTPEPLGKPVVLVAYVVDNLYHDMLAGRSGTYLLHFSNQTLVDCFSKRQACVQTSTFGSDIVAARISVDQLDDLRSKLQY
jgi:hypothetical protein